MLPKLFGPLAARYQDKTDEFTQVVVSGYRDYKKKSQGPTQYYDHAEMAFLEFSAQPKSVSFQLASGMLEKYREKLQEVQEELYDIETAQLVDPVTLKEYEHKDFKEKMLPMHRLKQLRKQEADFKRLVETFEETMDKGKENQEKHRQFLLNILEERQKQLDKNPSNERLLESLKLLGFEVLENNVLSVPTAEEEEIIAKETQEEKVVEPVKVEAVEQEEPKKEEKKKPPTFFRSRFESMLPNFRFK